MKNVMNTLKKASLYLGVFALSLGVSSCSDDDEGTVVIPETDASITVTDQVAIQNMITVDEVTVDEDAWLVVRKVEDDGSYSDLIAEVEQLTEGTHTNIEIQLDNTDAADVTLEDGDTLIFILHEDDGDGTFEYAGDTGADEVFTDAAGNVIDATITVSSPSITFSDQEVTDNGITFDNISTGANGWVVLHNADSEGIIDESDIIGWQYVPAGENQNIVVNFEEGFEFTPGQTVYGRLYQDDPVDEQFTFETNPGDDLPFFFGFGDDNTITGDIALQAGEGT